MEQVDCRRHKIKLIDGSKYYITIGPEHIMAHFPNESSHECAERYHALNAVCRLSSKLRGLGMSWDEIKGQINDAGIGYNTVMSQMVEAITYNQLLDEGINTDWVEPG